MTEILCLHAGRADTAALLWILLNVRKVEFCPPKDGVLKLTLLYRTEEVQGREVWYLPGLSPTAALLHESSPVLPMPDASNVPDFPLFALC